MRSVSLMLLGACTIASAAEAPPPKPAPPARVVVVLPPPEFSLAPQPLYGPLRPISPAHRLALLEARQSLTASDPLVARFSVLLTQLTARYVEDASRIEELTTALCQEIRARQRPVTPSEICEGALTWKRPSGSNPNVPRRFSDYARLYRTLRVTEGKDHKAALAALQSSSPSAKP